ncbi:carbamate kinase [Pilibacter termitis]|jgi:carbamate kinase|uniref:Carbamate kinase n=1 Tax=Pilibacter termitis TaxID=263852 RepID=A0A1T4L5Q7_9ENTE|nr:carbamate kinase [Pilibacter termitis]SJZ49881.1 carbamate kinase [Pilibacter termitis]
MSRKIVVALGGNAILVDKPTAEAQQEALHKTAKQLVKFIKNGDSLIISHGNGPQVGNLLLQQQAAESEKNPVLPLDTCVAMTEGSIGYWLQQAMREACRMEGLDTEVVSLVTQVVVDENDPSFHNPTKPIGPFFTEEEAKSKTDGVYKEDAGRGWRKVVASPRPIAIEEANVIKRLVNEGVVTISVGGGGVPVVRKGMKLEGREAVIDKDFASEKLAEAVEADMLLILTGVPNVFIRYNTPEQKKLEEVTVEEMKQYIADGEFAPGSMLPKVEAAVEFVENYPKGVAVISSLENLDAVVKGNSGTIVKK